MIPLQDFHGFAQRYARAQGARGTYVTFGGTMAYTSGKHINLPALPPGTVLTPWQAKVYTGYLDHELDHHRYTNFKNVAFIDPKKMPLRRTLWNIFEDIRIENKGIAQFPSTKIYLDACTQQIEWDKRDKIKKDPATNTLGYQILEAIYRECYETYRQAAVSFEQKETIDQFKDLAPIKEALKKLPKLRSEMDAAALAEEVEKLLPKNVDYKSPRQESEDGKPLFVILVPGKGSGDPAKDLGEIAVVFMGDHERSQTMDQLLEAIYHDNVPDGWNTRAKMPWKGEHILPPVGTAYDRIFVPSERDRASFDRVRDAASFEITATKRMLQIYLRSRTSRGWEKGLPTGRLDDEALASLFTGNRDVFMRRRDRTMMDTAVQLLKDESGSMNPFTCQQATIVAAEALGGVPKIKLSVAGFTTNDHSYTKGDGGRKDGLDILLYKDFDEPYQSAKDRLGAHNRAGLTPLGEAYAHGFTRLLVRKEKKRVLWLISDGDPYISLANDDHNEFLLIRKIFNRCKDNGIIVVCMNIGRMSGEMKKLCHAARNVGSHQELPAAVLEMMREIAA